MSADARILVHRKRRADPSLLRNDINMSFRLGMTFWGSVCRSTGFAGRVPRIAGEFQRGGSEPMALSEKQSCSVGRRWMYSFNHRKAKKEIPVQREIHG